MFGACLLLWFVSVLDKLEQSERPQNVKKLPVALNHSYATEAIEV